MKPPPRRNLPDLPDLVLVADEVVLLSPRQERAWWCVHRATDTKILKLYRWPDGQWCSYNALGKGLTKDAVGEGQTLEEAVVAGLDPYTVVPPYTRRNLSTHPSVDVVDVAGSWLKWPDDWARLETMVRLLGFPKYDDGRLQRLVEEGRE